MIFAASIALALAFLNLAAVPAHGAVLNVTVGGTGGLRYDPQFVNAQAGDQIIFTFKQRNHTATQSTFANPCTNAPGGFDTGFMPVPDNQTGGFPTQTLTVNDTTPIWMFCAQTGHCQLGMVFAVNPGDKFGAFQAVANGSSGS